MFFMNTAENIILNATAALAATAAKCLEHLLETEEMVIQRIALCVLWR